MKFVDFSEETWRTYSGAEPFPSGAQPRIAEVVIGVCAGSVIVDADGVSVIWDSNDGLMEVHLTGAAALLALTHLSDEMRLEDLRAAGFDLSGCGLG
jgi:hypothetical protein